MDCDDDQLLQSWLSSDVGIEAIDAVPRFTSLMRKYAQDENLWIPCINILQKSSPQILGSFFGTEESTILNDWLKDANDSGNCDILKELLPLIAINSHLSSQNEDTLEILTSLSNSNYDDEIVDLARNLIDSHRSHLTTSIGVSTRSMNRTKRTSETSDNQHSNNITEASVPMVFDTTSNITQPMRRKVAGLTKDNDSSQSLLTNNNQGISMIANNSSSIPRSSFDADSDYDDIEEEEEEFADFTFQSLCPTPQGPSKSFPRGCLSITPSIEKKKVRFLPDPWIQSVELFETDAEERINIYRLKSSSFPARLLSYLSNNAVTILLLSILFTFFWYNKTYIFERT